MANDFLITGEANVSGVTAGIRAIENSVADAKRAITELSRDTGEGASVIKSKMLIAQEAVKSLANEVKVAKLAAKNGLIDEDLAEKFKNELDVVQYELKRLSSQYKVIGAEIAQENAKIRTQVNIIAREERELYRKKQQEAKAAAVAMSRLHAEAIAEDARRTRLVLANARAVERAHGQAIAEDIRRANAARKNSQAIVDAQRKESDSHRLTLMSLKGLLAGYLSFGAIRSFIGATVESAVALERVRNSLIAATGSLRGGQEAFDYTRKLAYGLGLDLQALSKQYGLFSAAVKDSGFTQNQMRSIFESVAEASRVLGLSVEDMQGVFVALQQIATKGTVQMEELRQQLGDRLPGSVAIMAKALGVSQKELFALTKQGLIPAREALILFDIELRKTLVNKALPEALLGIQVKINNLRNSIFELKAAFGGGFAEGMAEAMGDFTKAANGARESADAAGEAIGKSFGWIAEWIGKFVQTLRLARVPVQAFSETVAASFDELSGNVHSAISSTAATIADFYDLLGNDKLKDKFQGVADAAGAFAEQAKRDAEQHKQNVADIYEYGQALKDLESGQGILATTQADLDSQTKRTMQTQRDAAEATLVMNAATGKSAQAHEDLIAAIRKKIAAEEEERSNTLKGIKPIVDVTGATEEHGSAIDKMVESIHKEQEAIEGNLTTLTSRGIILQEAIRLAEQDGIVTAAAADTIKQKVGEEYDAYERLGKAVPEWLQAIGDKYGAVSKAQQSFLDDLIAAADKAEERLTKASDAARDSSGMKFGEMDLTEVSGQIQEAQRAREQAVAELLAATDSAGIKKAQKRVDDAQKDIDDRVRRYKEIEAKIAGQNAEANAPNNEKVEALKKKADELRSEIAALENKQSSGSLSSEELGRLFEAKDALQDIKNEMGDVVGVQEQIHFGWSEIGAGTDAAYDAWEKYHALVQKNAIDAKLSLEGQIEAADDLASSADDIKVSLVKVGNQWVISNKAAKESSVELEKINGHWKVSSESAEDMADNVGLVAEEIKLLAVENRALDEVKPMETAAAATISMEASMERINATHLPKMISLMATLRGEANGVALGGGIQDTQNDL